MSREPQMPGPGDLVAERFRIERLLSRGGMGAVFVAHHVQTSRPFALKLMSSELAGDAEAEARFMREAKVASSLEHPAIVDVYDVGRHEGFPYMVMQLLQGESLGARIKRGRIPPDEALALLAPAIEGIAAAHARGIVHRDLKPDNIFLAAEGEHVRPKVLDFGISKLLDVETSQKLTATGVALGTPLYMSPEQVRGERDVDARTDVYSLGVILYEMLTGVPPFSGGSFANLVYRIVTGDAQPLRALQPSLSPQLEQVVARAMAVDPAQRHPDVGALLDDLRAVVGGAAPAVHPRISRTSSDAAAPTPFTTEASSLPPIPSRSPHLTWLALATVAILAALAFAWLRMGEAGDVAGEQPPLPAAAGAPRVGSAAQPPPAPASPSAATAPVAEPPAPGELPRGVAPPPFEPDTDEAAAEPAAPRRPSVPPKPTAADRPPPASAPDEAPAAAAKPVVPSTPAPSPAADQASPASTAAPGQPEPDIRALDDQPRNPFE